MNRIVFGETDSPRLVRIKRKAARIEARRNPRRAAPVFKVVCWDGGGRCTPASCEIAEGCAGPVPNPDYPRRRASREDR